MSEFTICNVCATGHARAIKCPKCALEPQDFDTLEAVCRKLLRRIEALEKQLETLEPQPYWSEEKGDES